VQRADGFVADLIFAEDLLHDQFRVRVNMQFAAVCKNSESQSGKQGGVLGEVVGSGTEIFRDSSNPREVDTDPSLARITARAAVDVSFELH
jgi:hypothetical protein